MDHYNPGYMLTLQQRIRLLPNPARFSINDITFAASSVDVIYHLRKEELLKRGKEADSISPSLADDTGTDPMANTCRQLLQQRRCGPRCSPGYLVTNPSPYSSFYPLFPVPPDVTHEVNLSVTHLGGLNLTDDNKDYAPDVLVLPSRLKQFSKVCRHGSVGFRSEMILIQYQGRTIYCGD